MSEKLTGRELDAEIAREVFGQHLYHDFVGKDYAVGSRLDDLPQYSEDMTAAWKIVNKIVECGYGFALFRWPVLSSAGRGVYVVFKKGVQVPDLSALKSDKDGVFVGHAPTEPEAVCRAALDLTRGSELWHLHA